MAREQRQPRQQDEGPIREQGAPREQGQIAGNRFNEYGQAMPQNSPSSIEQALYSLASAMDATGPYNDYSTEVERARDQLSVEDAIRLLKGYRDTDLLNAWPYNVDDLAEYSKKMWLLDRNNGMDNQIRSVVGRNFGMDSGARTYGARPAYWPAMTKDFPDFGEVWFEDNLPVAEAIEPEPVKTEDGYIRAGRSSYEPLNSEPINQMRNDKKR